MRSWSIRPARVPRRRRGCLPNPRCRWWSRSPAIPRPSRATLVSWSTAAIGSLLSCRSISSATLPTWKSSRGLRGDLSDTVSPIIQAVAPPLLPHALADRAGDARRLRGRRHDACDRRAACDFEHQLGAHGVLEFLALFDRHHKRARSADDAILVVNIE